MEMICSSEKSVDFQQATQLYIPEDGTLDNHCCENLKFYKSTDNSTRAISYVKTEDNSKVWTDSVQNGRILYHIKAADYT
jgi:hypothetical protein